MTQSEKLLSQVATTLKNLGLIIHLDEPEKKENEALKTTKKALIQELVQTCTKISFSLKRENLSTKGGKTYSYLKIDTNGEGTLVPEKADPKTVATYLVDVVFPFCISGDTVKVEEKTLSGGLLLLVIINEVKI